MSGSAFTTVSPSNSSRMRSTPCVEGCCGPMFSTIVRAGPVAVCTVVASAIPFHGIILAQGITFPILWHQDAPQIRMPFESHAEQVKCLTLVPVDPRPHRRQRCDNRIAAGYAYADPQLLPARNRKQVVVQFKSWFDGEA